MRLVFAIVFFYLLFAIYVMAHAAGQVTVKITPDPSGHLDKVIDIISAVTNKDKTTTFNFYACGSIIEVVVDEDLMKVQSPVVIQTVDRAIANACRFPNP